MSALLLIALILSLTSCGAFQEAAMSSLQAKEWTAGVLYFCVAVLAAVTVVYLMIELVQRTLP